MPSPSDDLREVAREVAKFEGPSCPSSAWAAVEHGDLRRWHARLIAIADRVEAQMKEAERDADNWRRAYHRCQNERMRDNA